MVQGAQGEHQRGFLVGAEPGNRSPRRGWERGWEGVGRVRAPVGCPLASLPLLSQFPRHGGWETVPPAS